MIPLHAVDAQQIVDVQTGKRTGRGCGKTIAKMIQLLSYLRYCNADKRYLFICENDFTAQQVNDYFFDWIREYGLYAPRNDGYYESIDLCGVSAPQRDYYVTIHPPFPDNFWDALKDIFQPIKPGGHVYVKFIAANWEIPMGTGLFDNIIIDVSPDTHNTHIDEIKKVLYYAQKN